MDKMEVDDVVDLSMGRDSLSLTQETVRDLQALSQNSGLTITPAPPTNNANNGNHLGNHSFRIEVKRSNLIKTFGLFF